MANEEFGQALESTREIELTVTGRRSGRAISIPVWFVWDGDRCISCRSTDRTPTGTRMY